ncbi:hypothetical protein PybrP1_009792 [[Pythium] brassicae (nom. inval.)]|nr:hypothetical protein PybrP1_009792 [[Pythium] brassicae (nom. inval.)]
MNTPPPPPPPPLELVTVTLALTREGHDVSNARALVASLPHAVASITNCLVDARSHELWSLPRACEKNLLTSHLWAFRCARGLVFAVRNDNLAMTEWLHAHCAAETAAVPMLPYAAMVEAARNGNTRMLEWLSARHERAAWIPQMMAAAASTGRVAMLQWLHDHPKNVGCTRDASSAAASGGHLAAFEWLDKHYGGDAGAPLSDVINAIRKGHIDFAKFLFENKRWSNHHVSAGLQCAAERGNLEMTKWIWTESPTPFSDATAQAVVNAAAHRGHAHIVRWFHERRSGAFSPVAMDRAAQNGNLELVQWLDANRSEGCTTSAMDDAAAGGHLAVVAWLHAHRSEGCTSRAMDSAARNGHLAVVTWLHAHRSEGCTVRAMDDAAAGGHLAVVTWLHAHRSEGCTVRAIDDAARGGHLEVVRWLHAHRSEGCSSRAMDDAARGGHLGVVQWLHAHSREGCTARAMDAAAKSGHLETLQWLCAHRSEGCTMQAMIDAAVYHQLAVVKWLVEIQDEARADAATPRIAPALRARWRRETRALRESSAAAALLAATESGCLEVVRWLCARRSENGLDPLLYTAAVTHSHFEILLHLHAECSADFPLTLLSLIPLAEVTLANLEMARWMHATYPGTVDVARCKQQNHDLGPVLDSVLGLPDQ